MTTNFGASPEAERGHDILDERLRGELDRRVGEAEPARRAGAPARSIPRPRRRRRARRDRATAAQAWISSVDLPMPGSPPIRVAEPGTKPPPATRSSSPMPVTTRGSGFDAPDRSSSGKGRPARAAPRGGAADAERRGFLDDGVPLAAGLAFSLPALRDRAAVLADIRRAQPRHGPEVAVLPGLSSANAFPSAVRAVNSGLVDVAKGRAVLRLRQMVPFLTGRSRPI